MRDSDKSIFQEAAKPGVIHTSGLWILVRDTNEYSFQYIGLPFHTPKGRDCKAKTANRLQGAEYQNAGLVVDPNLCPDSFKTDLKLADAKWEWKQFTKKHPIRPWNFDANGKSRSETFQHFCTVNTDKNDKTHYGCLLFHGNYLYGDYDLYDIIIPEQAERNLSVIVGDSDNPGTQGKYFTAVQKYVNARIGVPMVQHGAQAQGFGHIDNDTVWIFTPSGSHFVEDGNIQALYTRLFPGRSVEKIFRGPTKLLLLQGGKQS